MDMKGKWAVVLGTTGGTGGATARALSRDRGLNIFGMHRGHWPEEAERIQHEVKASGCECCLLKAGAGSVEEAEAGASHLLELAGPGSVQVFVHAIADASYGVFAADPERMLHPKQLDKTFRVMAHSFVYWVQELVRRDLLAPNATLIALGNPMPDSVVHGWGVVAAAKEALRIYVRQIADELGPRGIRTMLIKFGLVETQAIRIAFSDEEWDALRKRLTRIIPRRRLQTVDEVAGFISYVAGQGTDCFNGSTIDFSGGQTSALLNPVFHPDDYL